MDTALTTPLCQAWGLSAPIVQAPIGSATTPELAAAVSESGGLGTLALTWVTPAEARHRIRGTRRLTRRPFGVNLVLDFPVQDLLAVCLDEGVPIVSTFWGDPAAVTARVHAAGARHVHTVGSVEEARRAAGAGVDAVVAQGWEAGGHVRGRTTTMALVPAVADAVHPVPVLAAGGIADGRGLAAALALGAQAGWLGTRFLTAREANTHQAYRTAVRRATADGTTCTGCFDGGWPDAPHRALRNSTVTAWERAGRPPHPHRPGEGDVVATTADGRKHLRYDDMIPTRDAVGDLEAMALYAGQAAGLVTHTTAPAAEIVRTVAEHAAGILNGTGHRHPRHHGPAVSAP
ncbi:nitronate monooxygenase [Streptomyces sp. RS10V-4]|uniref:NAD(P)H-dependent flavin oxidoreductase n=1 Tax=Streptomyces rhizoryzae TaxID=2932493 RepID=UPI002003BD68|nr:nitronate monooxygenase [Streptomyces rhizoryzae]MCK7622402.1 nitronate monooxygenase [Streptomyces rhizoryzae]